MVAISIAPGATLEIVRFVGGGSAFFPVDRCRQDWQVTDS